jgi:sulfate permease, SulP family
VRLPDRGERGVGRLTGDVREEGIAAEDSRLRRLCRPVAGDVVGGASVALVLIPQSLAYAQLAGMPAVRGLYASALPPLAAAPFSSSPYLQPGPTAISALLTFGALAPLAVVGSPEYVALGLALALVVGVLRIIVGAFRLGFIAYLLSQPMLLGFVPAAALLILASQLPIALGSDPPAGGVLRQAGWAIVHPGDWELAALGLSLGTIVLLLVGPRIHRLFPAVLLVVAAGILYSDVTDYTGATVGSISAALPPFSLDLPWRDVPSLLASGAVIALLGFAEAASIARTYAALERKAWDPDREFVGQGMANVAAGLSGGFPVGASFSRSALNRLAGARTSFSAIVTGLTVLAFLPAASVLAPLPQAVLAAIVMVAVVGLVKLAPLVRLAHLSRPQFVVAGATFVLTLALSPHVERAVLAGIILAVGVHLWRELSLELPSWIDEDTLHLRPRGVLWFGTAARLEDTFLGLLGEHPGSRRLFVHLDGLGRIDMTGALALRGLLQEARTAGLDVEIVDVRPRWQGLVQNVISQREDPLGAASRGG